MDIRPGSPLNIVNFSSNGVLPAAILGSPTFDVARIDGWFAPSSGSGMAPTRNWKAR